MARNVMNILLLLSALTSVNAYWLMGIEDFITTERLDPIVNPGAISGHVHSVLGGSNFRMTTNTEMLRNSDCTSIPIPEDKSNYWFPHLYFQWANGSFTSLNGGAVIYYLFSDTPGTTTAFPDDFRMLSGTPTLRTYDPNSYAQQAITFLCLDFDGTSTRFNSLPAQACPSGIRAQVNFPSCWDGKNLDSADHKSHVAFLSGGPDQGSCSDPKFPITLPRIFIEVYWASNDFDSVRSQAMDPSQPFVYSYGDPTGYGYHADFINGWDKGVLQNAVDKCHCNPYGDPTCCVDQGIFHMNKGQQCRITKAIDEATTGTLAKLPGNNPVQKEGKTATVFPDTSRPALLSPIYAYTGNSPTAVGTPVPQSGSVPSSAVASPSSSAGGSVPPSNAPAPPVPSSAVASPSSSVGSSPSSSNVSTPPASLPVAIGSAGSPTPSSHIPSVPSASSGASISSSMAGVSSPSPTGPPLASTSASSATPSVSVGGPHSSAVAGSTTIGGSSSAPNLPSQSSSTMMSSPTSSDDDSSPCPPETTSLGTSVADSSPTASPPPSSSGSGSSPPSNDSSMADSSSPTPTMPFYPSSSPSPSAASSSPTSQPLPPSSGTGSNSSPPNGSSSNNSPGSQPPPNSPPGVPSNGSESSPNSDSDPSQPAATLIIGAGDVNSAPSSPAPTGITSTSTTGSCPGGKFRHKQLKAVQMKAQRRDKPSRNTRSFHENGRRFMKSHARAFK